MASYVLLSRDTRTLALQGEIPVFVSCEWSRQYLDGGEFTLVVHKDTLNSLDLVATNRMIEVQRDGVHEFAGVIRSKPSYDPHTRLLTLKGPSLTRWWLTRATAIPPDGDDHDTQAGVPAETALKHYVNAHIVTPTDTARAVSAELGPGVLFTVEPDYGRGAAVTVNARYGNLLTTWLVPAARIGEVWHAVVIRENYDGYEYRVYAPRDATDGTANAVVFSYDNTGSLTYEEDYTATANAVYVLGQGEGATRAVLLVEDGESLDGDFRRETAIDSRNNATSEAMITDGQTYILQGYEAAVRLDAQPTLDPDNPTRYRTTWDLGMDITVSVPELNVQVDKRIVEVTVQLQARGTSVSDQVSVALGATQRTAARRISDALARSQRVSAN